MKQGGMMMEGYYEIICGEQPVGKAEIIRYGLYYHIDCRCIKVDERIYRVVVLWDSGCLNLGVPVPEGKGLGLAKKIPVKYLKGPVEKVLLIPAELSNFDTLSENRLAKPLPEKEIAEEVNEQAEELNTNDIKPNIASETTQKHVSTGFIEIVNNEPLDILEIVHESVLTSQDDCIGINDDHIFNDNPTGQWSEPNTSE